MESVKEKLLTRGGEFLIRSGSPMDIFTPEQWEESHLTVAGMVRDFISTHVHPVLDKIDSYDPPMIMRDLLKLAGSQGILGISVPSEYDGGFGEDFNTSMLVTENLGAGHSFSVATAAHTGIGTLPILYFGNEEQKNKYLPKLASGEWLASYCLTEPGSGSDALGAKTRADLTPDGKHYVLNGQKMWITNAGFADVFIVFAKIDGEKFTGFIVERTYEGISFNEEEKKMGIKGSSTRQVFFTNVHVPVENVLGEIGKGHQIAFNILNIGRIKLAAATLGGAKVAISKSVKYANERQQFKRPISSFGAIQYKIAEQIVRAWVTESATYRCSNDIQETEHKLLSEGKSYGQALLGAAEEFAAECALMKVLGSETLDYVVDEGVQIFGGYGFSAEFPMDRAYRDSRINRIFEGTNEINRMLTVNYLLQKAMKGQLDLLTPSQALQKAALNGAVSTQSFDDTPFSYERAAITNLKNAFLLALSAAVTKYMDKLRDEQEVLMSLADMVMFVYAAESALLRAERIALSRGAEAASLYYDIARVYLNDTAERIGFAGRNVFYAIASGDEQARYLQAIATLTALRPFNVVEARRRIAAVAIAENDYKL
jgi:alkylation response protein AidB-like acyl-CoA dehydrogenase